VLFCVLEQPGVDNSSAGPLKRGYNFLKGGSDTMYSAQLTVRLKVKHSCR